MEKRLCGREQEYGMRIDPPYQSSPSFSDKNTQKYVDPDFDHWRRGFVLKIIKNIAKLDFPVFYWDYTYNNESRIYDKSQVWLANGSLMYIDLNCILEASSAEYSACSYDGILQEKSSEMILNEAINLVIVQKKINSLTLYKNNVGPARGKDIFKEVTYASHHNYSYVASKRNKVFFFLKNFVPVSLFLSGNGHVYRRNGQAVFLLSQRANHIFQEKSSLTTSARPIINIKDEDLMDESTGYKRLHLISRDATRCEFQTWLVDGITHLVLRLAEEGWVFPFDFILNNPVAEMKSINFSLGVDLNYRVKCREREINLFAYNRFFLDAAKQLSPLSEQEKRVLAEWERVLELLEARAFDKLVGEIDWITKWWLIKNKMKKHNFGLDDIRAWKIDMGYHDISNDPKKSWFALLDQGGYIRHLVSEQAIKQAMTIPPETRAKSRGEFLKLLSEKPNLSRMVVIFSWEYALINYINDKNKIKIYFGEKSDPFSPASSTLEEFKRLIA
jgi:proteasome accessory factor A